MWLIFGVIAMGSFVLLVLAKNWIGKDFKTKAARPAPPAGRHPDSGGRVLDHD